MIFISVQCAALSNFTPMIFLRTRHTHDLRDACRVFWVMLAHIYLTFSFVLSRQSVQTNASSTRGRGEREGKEYYSVELFYHKTVISRQTHTRDVDMRPLVRAASLYSKYDRKSVSWRQHQRLVDIPPLVYSPHRKSGRDVRSPP